MKSQSPAMVVKEAPGKKRSCSIKRTQGKVPKRIHKAEREKLKREDLNDLFLNLANALEMTEQNSGKASILCEATRLLKDLFGQIQCLKKEHASLLSESHYVTLEKDELEEEKTALETEVEKLKVEVQSKVTRCESDLNVNPLDFQQPELIPKFVEESVSLAAAQPTLSQGAAVFVVPVHHELPAFQVPSCAEVASRPTPNISKPHARYPTPSDSWPSQLQGKQATSS